LRQQEPKPNIFRKKKPENFNPFHQKKGRRRRKEKTKPLTNKKKKTPFIKSNIS